MGWENYHPNLEWLSIICPNEPLQRFFSILVWVARARHVLANKKTGIKKIAIKVRIRIYL